MLCNTTHEMSVKIIFNQENKESLTLRYHTGTYLSVADLCMSYSSVKRYVPRLPYCMSICSDATSPWYFNTPENLNVFWKPPVVIPCSSQDLWQVYPKAISWAHHCSPKRNRATSASKPIFLNLSVLSSRSSVLWTEGPQSRWRRLDRPWPAADRGGQEGESPQEQKEGCPSLTSVSPPPSSGYLLWSSSSLSQLGNGWPILYSSLESSMLCSW